MKDIKGNYELLIFNSIMSLQIEFRSEQKKFILRLPLDDSLEVMERYCQDELSEFFSIIKPLCFHSSFALSSRTIPSLTLINAIRKIINRVDGNKLLRVKQYRIACEELKIINCECLSGIILKGREGYYHIIRTANGCTLEKRELSEDGTKIQSVNPINIDTCVIETDNMGVIRISAKKLNQLYTFC